MMMLLSSSLILHDQATDVPVGFRAAIVPDRECSSYRRAPQCAEECPASLRPAACYREQVSKWRSPSLFPAAFLLVQGDECCRPRAAQKWRLSCSPFKAIAEFGRIGKNKGSCGEGRRKGSVNGSVNKS